MISNNVPATPRPRPPAQMRRNPSLNAPPPPYAPPLERLLDSPISITAQLVAAAASPDGNNQLTPLHADVEDWMNEKSKEELSDLLLKADDLIRSRETGTLRSIAGMRTPHAAHRRMADFAHMKQSSA